MVTSKNIKYPYSLGCFFPVEMKEKIQIGKEITIYARFNMKN